MDNFNGLTILIVTSKNYSFLVDEFIKRIKRYWPDNQLEIVLTNNSFLTDLNQNLKNIKFIHDESKKSTWSSTIYEGVQGSSGYYTLIFLEDYLITDNIDVANLKWWYKDVIKNKIDHSYYADSFDPEMVGKIINASKNQSKMHIELKKKISNANYLITAGGIYKTESLLKIIKKGENAWEFERFGSIRALRFKGFRTSIYYSSENPLRFPSGGLINKGELRTDYKMIYGDSLDVNTIENASKIVKKSNRSLLNKVIFKIKIALNYFK